MKALTPLASDFINKNPLPMNFTKFQERFFSSCLYEIKIIKKLVDESSKDLIKNLEIEIDRLFN